MENRVMMAADLVVNEIMYQPSSHNVADEWIELYNKGDAAANLNNWKLDKGVNFTFGDVTVNPGQYLVVAANLARFQSQHVGVSNVVGGWTGTLSNTQEEIRVIDATGATADSVTYSDQGDWGKRRPGPNDLGYTGWDWVQPASGLGKTLELINPVMTNNNGQNWDTSIPVGGTPGAQNSVRSTDIAPLISNLKQSIILPKSTDDVYITAKIVDELGAPASAQVFWRVDNIGAQFAPTTMVDNGTNGDVLANDGIWTGMIPRQLNKRIVEFYVKATDAGNKSRTWPAPTDANGTQGANALYQVDDTVYTGNEPLYRLIFTEAERQTLATMQQNAPNSNAKFNATFIQNDARGPEIHYLTGVRNRGHGSRSGTPHNYHIDFAADDPWHGRTSINFNARTRQAQLLGNSIWHLANIAASSDSLPIQVQVNGNAPLGSNSQFVMNEETDSAFAANHFPDDSNGNYYRTDRDIAPADLVYLGTDPTPYRNSYFKATNADLDDWTDLIQLTNVLNNTPANQLYAAAQQVMDVDQWIKYIALDNLMQNTETELGSGYGDDYGLYRGTIDTRFKLVMHDQDSIMGSETADFSRSIFAFLGFRGLQKLFAVPEVLQKFYQAHLDLIQQFFNPTTLNPLIDNVLTGVASAGQIAAYKTWAVNRINNVLSQIPQTFSITAPLAVVNGYPQTSGTTTSLSGKANAAKTLSVLVGGVPATYDARAGSWSIPTVPLKPGINRIVVQAFDGVNGTGKVVNEGFIDVVSTAAPAGVTIPGGTLPAGNTTWSPANGPYTVQGDVVVPAGSTLTILPGTTVYFVPNSGLQVNGGQLLAEGTKTSHIRFTRAPGFNAPWDGVQFTNSNLDNRLTYADLEYAGTSDDGMLGVTNSKVTVDHAHFANTDRRRIRFTNASLIVRDSVFTDIFASGVNPTTDNLSEQVFGSGILAGGQVLFERNTFGTTKGHNDIMNMTGGSRPGAVFVIRDNVFNGGGDDALNLSGDALIEGNTFKSFVRDAFNADPGNPSVLSLGGGFNYTVGRNTILNSGFVVEVKQNAFVTFVNNTVVNTTPVAQATFSFAAPDAPGQPGRGATIDGNVFKGRTSFGTLTGQTTVTRNVVTGVGGLPAGNSSEDPRFVDEANGNYALRASSPGKGLGPNGVDAGAVSPRVSISGEPSATTGKTTATLTVGGPGIVSYFFQINGGGYGFEQPVGTPINLSGLAPGTYTVQVVARNDAGELLDVVSSRTWTVVGQPTVRVNEVLAINNNYLSNGSTFPDLIELYNHGDAPVDLSGMSITDDPAAPLKYVFPNGTSIAPGQYLILYADSKVVAGQLHTGFSLKSDGEGAFLYNKPQLGGGLVDGVALGAQLENLSVGRLADGTWALNQPTFGSANVAQRTGDPSTLKINEWNTQGVAPFQDDYIEIYNPDPLPIAIGGFYLTDHPASQPGLSKIPLLSFIPGNTSGAGGYAVFTADGDQAAGALHTDFSLNSEQGMIGLFDQNKVKIDEVLYLSQRLGKTMGRSPDGGPLQAFYNQPSPGLPNPGGVTSAVPLRITEINFNPPKGTGSTSSDYEFIEFKNVGASPLNLNGFKLAGAVSFTFGNVTLNAGQTIVLVRDAGAFVERFGTGINVGGQFVGGLDDGGAQLRLTDSTGAAILDFGYSDAWQPTADGRGNSIVVVDPVGTAAANWGLPTTWRASRTVLGTPGIDEDAAAASPPIVINEVVAHTAGNASDWIEIRNTTGGAADISGWYLSNDAAHLLKYRLPAGTIIPANGYLVLNQATSFGANGANSFSLDGSSGGDVYLSNSTGTGVLGGYRQGVEFGASDLGVSQGRYTTSTGQVDFPMMTTPTPGAANAAPLVGPIVLTEIMYHPSGAASEYLELFNRSSRTVDLTGWRFTNGLDFTFPAGTKLAPGAYLLLVPEDAAEFRATHNVPASVQIIGGHQASLNNQGETIELSRPGVAEAGAPVGTVPMVVDDRLRYEFNAPWPVAASGSGPSLERLGPALYANDPASWRADAVSSGAGGSPGTGAAFLAPTVVGSPEFVGAKTVKFVFGIDVSVDASDLTLVNQTTGQTIPGASMTFAYDPTTRTATWTSATVLADGDYTATLNGAGIQDATGSRSLDGNGDGVGGDNYTVALFKFAGDANHDRSVNFSDLVLLAQNYNLNAGQRWETGDFNGDGATNFSDLVPLAQNYNKTFPAPTEAVPAPAPVMAASAMSFAQASAAAFAKVNPTPAPTPAPTPTVTPTPTPVVTKPVVTKPVVVAKPVAKPVVTKPVVAKPVVTKPVARAAVVTPPPASPFSSTRIGKAKASDVLV